MCGGGRQTTTQKTELDPVLQAHLYGDPLPEGAMTGIMPVYFQPGGSLAGQAGNVQSAYDAMQVYTPPAPAVNAAYGRQGGGRDDSNNIQNFSPAVRGSAVGNNLMSTIGSYAPGGVNTRNPGSRFNEIAASVRDALSGPRGPTANDVPVQRPDRDDRKDGGLIKGYQVGGEVSSPNAMTIVDPNRPRTGTPMNLAASETSAPPTFTVQEGQLRPLSLAEQVYQLTVGTDLGSMIPEYGVAERSKLQDLASQMVLEGIGAYSPAVGGGSGAGIQALQQALGGVGGADVTGALQRAMEMGQSATGQAGQFQGQALEQLARAGEVGERSVREYDPTSAYQAYMDPFLEEVIAQSERDLTRQGQIQENQLRAQAVGQGAFGGSRSAVAERELGRNVAEQQARTSSALRSEGYRTAQQQAQQAFESQQQREANLAGLYGQLGQATGSLGAQYGQLGLSQAQLGAETALGQGRLALESQGLGIRGAEALGQLGLAQDRLGLESQRLGQQVFQQGIGNLLTLGGQEQAYQQALLDTARMNEYQRIMAPFQQTAFRADILSGAPTGITSTMSQPGPSLGSQLVGLGTAAYGLGQAGGLGGIFNI